MKVSSLKVPAIVALALSAATSAATALPMVRLARGGPSVVLVDCAFGWYRGPDGRCYVAGTRPRYHRDEGYDRRRDWHRDEYRRDEYRRHHYGRPYEEHQDDER
jgi:hypothetical protein